MFLVKDFLNRQLSPRKQNYFLPRSAVVGLNMTIDQLSDDGVSASLETAKLELDSDITNEWLE